MSRFRFREMRVKNYRCFKELRLLLEEDTTVFFAENGGGKTALLTALAMGLAVFESGAPKALQLDAKRDPTMRTLDEKGRREPVGPCRLDWTATVGQTESVTWRASASPAAVIATMPLGDLDQFRVPGDRWPLFGWYGVDRLARHRGRRRKVERTGDRWEAYDSSLDPNLDEAPLLQWLQDEMLGDVVRRQHDESERFFDKAVMDATVQATPGVTNAWYDPVEQGPKVRFENGHVAPWSRAVRRLSRVHRAGRRHRPPSRHAQPVRRRRRARASGGGSARRRDRPASPSTMAARCASPPSQRISKAATRRHHPLTTSAEQRREPPSAPTPWTGRFRSTPCWSRAETATRSSAEYMRTEDRSAEGTEALRDAP